MSKGNVGIVTECVCDLPKSILCKYDIDIAYFLIKTDRGIFADTDEITAENILEYMKKEDRKTTSSAPGPEAYRKIFEKKLDDYNEILHIASSGKLSDSCTNARKAVSQMGDLGKRVHIFDSQHCSTGLGHLVLLAAEKAAEGASLKEITADLKKRKNRISATFITENADFLYRAGYISEKTRKVCEWFHLHPVLTIKDGLLSLPFPQFGDYETACRRYLAKTLKNPDTIDAKRAFITHTDCSLKKIEALRRDVASHCIFEELIVTEASATLSGRCGPNTFGILYIRNER